MTSSTENLQNDNVGVVEDVVNEELQNDAVSPKQQEPPSDDQPANEAEEVEDVEDAEDVEEPENEIEETVEAVEEIPQQEVEATAGTASAAIMVESLVEADDIIEAEPLPEVRSGSKASQGSSHGAVYSPMQQERIKVTLVLPLERRYTCPQCNDVMRYPMFFEECGHHVCSPCYFEFLRVEPRCPVDQIHFDKDKTYVDKALNKEIMLLDTKCGNSIWGCTWEGPLREAQLHAEKCEYADVLCVNECGAKFQRRFLQKHLDKDCQKKSIACAYCEEKFLREEKKAHLEDCMKVPLPCPNKCDKSITVTRDELDKHIEQECPRTKIVCQFEEIGCPHKCTREKLAKHYKGGIVEHVRLLYDLVMKEGQRLDQHQEFLHEHGAMLEAHQAKIGDMERTSRSQLIWRIDEFSRKMKEAQSGNTTTLFSPPFNTSKHGYRLCASICLNGDGKGKGTHISAFVSILKGAYDNLLKWPFSYRVTFYLLDQNSDPASRKHIKFSIKPNPCPDNEPFLGQPKMEKNASFGGAKFAKHEDLEDEDRSYVKFDTIFLKIAIDCDGSAEP